MAVGANKAAKPHILVFSTDPISDPGIDMAGSAHMHYSPNVKVVSVPCSSCIKPEWILHALQNGFDGVFIAADGEDCAKIPTCTELTGKLVKASQDLLHKHNIDKKRLKMAAICSVCAEPFVKHMNALADTIIKLENTK